jgi:hypothetical protein
MARVVAQRQRPALIVVGFGSASQGTLDALAKFPIHFDQPLARPIARLPVARLKIADRRIVPQRTSRFCVKPEL